MCFVYDGVCTDQNLLMSLFLINCSTVFDSIIGGCLHHCKTTGDITPSGRFEQVTAWHRAPVDSSEACYAQVSHGVEVAQFYLQ